MDEAQKTKTRARYKPTIDPDLDAIRDELIAAGRIDLLDIPDAIARTVYTQGLEKEDLRADADVSRAAFRDFSRLTGTAALKVHAALRVNIGAMILESEPVTAEEVSNILRFNHPSAFSSSFKKYFKMRPGEYQKKSIKAAAEGVENTAHAALAQHKSGYRHRQLGEVDKAYEDLGLARGLYVRAGRLPPDVLTSRKGVPLSEDTDSVLIRTLCPTCAERFLRPEGETIRRFLRHSCLSRVPEGIEFFDVCCPDCYRAVYDAIERARAGILDNAYEAVWISRYANPDNPDGPPTLGRYIAATAEVMRLVSGDQKLRKMYADLAVRDAEVLADLARRAQAHYWRSAPLSTMGHFPEAGADLAIPLPAGTPWAEEWGLALRERMMAVKYTIEGRNQESFQPYAKAARKYHALDPHLAGLVLVTQGASYSNLELWRMVIEINEKAKLYLDEKRDPVTAFAAVPIYLARSFAATGRKEQAEITLESCDYDRAKNPAWHALELDTAGSIELLFGNPSEAIPHHTCAAQIFGELGRPREEAANLSCLADASFRIGDFDTSLRVVESAISIFERAGLKQDGVVALRRIIALAQAGSTDFERIAREFRGAARSAGSWLPMID